jgi:hypothetical protein
MTFDGMMGRRTLLAMGLCLGAPSRLLAQAVPSRRPVSFEVWRRGEKIGAHAVSFQGGDQEFTVASEAEMVVRFGPLPIRYKYEAIETWRGGQFAGLESHTQSSLWRDHVSAVRSADGVAITTGRGRVIQAPANTHPLTHWNSGALQGPVFNPQTGALTHERVSRSPDETVQLADGRSVAATRYALTGDVELSDWYDGKDVWAALHGKLPDGSYIDYRRTA